MPTKSGQRLQIQMMFRIAEEPVCSGNIKI